MNTGHNQHHDHVRHFRCFLRDCFHHHCSFCATTIVGPKSCPPASRDSSELHPCVAVATWMSLTHCRFVTWLTFFTLLSALSSFSSQLSAMKIPINLVCFSDLPFFPLHRRCQKMQGLKVGLWGFVGGVTLKSVCKGCSCAYGKRVFGLSPNLWRMRPAWTFLRTVSAAEPKRHKYWKLLLLPIPRPQTGLSASKRRKTEQTNKKKTEQIDKAADDPQIPQPCVSPQEAKANNTQPGRTEHQTKPLIYHTILFFSVQRLHGFRQVVQHVL